MSSSPEKTTSSPIASKASNDPDQAPEKESEGSFKDYFRVFGYANKSDWALYAIAWLAGIASGAALPLMSLVFGTFTTKFNNFSTGISTPDQFKNDVDHFVLWFIYLFIGRFFASYIATASANIAAIRTTRNLRKAFFEATLRQELWHFDNKNNGAIATQVTTNGNKIQSGIAEKLVYIVQAMSMFMSAFIIAVVTQWKLGLITMTVLPAIFVVTAGCIAADSVIEAKVLRFYSRAAVLAEEVLSSIRTVKAFYAHDKLTHQYDEFLTKAHKVGNKKCFIYGLLFSTQTFCVFSGVALAFWQGFRMYQSGEIESVGTVFTVVLTITIASSAISSLLGQFEAVTNASSAASELFRIVDKPSLLDPLSTAGSQPSSCSGNITITDLNFAYPSRPSAAVLRGLSLDIPAGKTVALVGASGSGKSTLVGLLERWYLPNSGCIFLDGKPLQDYNVKWLRRQMRLVQQEPTLFRGTVYQNIAKGFTDDQRKLPDDKKMYLVREACKASNADGFIEELPEGYSTEVGERASTLSGGQRQRIAIARSIISNPKILLLDEATSALDPKAERVVQEALGRVSVNRTTLIIAHKLSTVKEADSIAVVSGGTIVEQGSHQELIDQDGHYAALVRAQDLGHTNVDKEVDQYNEKRPLELSEDKMTLQRTPTGFASTTGDPEKQQLLSSGTAGYSLVRCIWILFSEHKSLYWCFIVQAMGCIAGGATYPAQAILFSKLLTVFELTGDEARSRANFYALMFFVVALGNLVAFFAIGWTCNLISQAVTHSVRAEMLEHVMNQDVEFFDLPDNTAGALTSKLSSLPTQVQALISTNTPLILIILVNLIGSSALAISYGWKLGLVVVFGGLPPLIFAGYIRIRLESRIDSQTGDQFAESAGLANEAVSAMRTVSSLTLESEFLAEYADKLNNIVLKSVRALVWTMFWFALSQSIEFLAMALGFWYGSRLLASGDYTTSQFYIIFIGVIFAGQAAAQFFGYTTSITQAGRAANYIMWLRTLKPTITETSENKDLGPAGNGSVDLQNLQFRYRQRETARVIRGISMEIEDGQFVAFVGASGCGKSTLVALLERFYDPTSGTISFGQNNIADMSPRSWRGHMSLVQQEPTLYSGSVKENVSLGLEYEPSEDEVREACRQANALDFVMSLPEGLDTSCGSRGMQFSGGQRQRIAIARALIRKPGLLLLDEATSALDTQSERIVQAALDEAAVSRTTIAVAHRLSTIRHADVIFVIAAGRIAETGTHAELQRQRGLYYEMCLSQSLDKD